MIWGALFSHPPAGDNRAARSVLLSGQGALAVALGRAKPNRLQVGGEGFSLFRYI